MMEAIDVVIVLGVLGCLCPPFISKGTGVMRKILRSVIIIV
jgi:hypothetical protein